MSKPIPKFRDLSLGLKLILYFVMLILVPLLVAAFVIHAKTSDVVLEKTKDSLLQVLKQTRFSIENIAREMDYVSLTVLSDELLQELIQFYTDKKYLDVERSKTKLFVSFDALLNSKPYINSISVSRGEEIIFQYGDAVQREDTRFHAAAEALQGSVYWTPMYLLQDRYKSALPLPVISLVRAVNDLNAFEQLAIERVTMNEGYLASLYAGIHSWQGGRIFILDAEGRVLSSPDKQWLGLELGGEPHIAKLLAQESAIADQELDGGRMVLLHYTVAGTGWKVVQMIPHKELLPELAVVNLIVVVCLSLCLGFGILLFIIQSKSIIHPLKLLAKEMSKVKAGNLAVQLKPSSNDEIGRVSHLFIEMVRTIETLIERVYKGQLRVKEAELKMLQAQINPHFLYNTLDSIRWMAVKHQAYDVGEQIEALADLFRHTLNQGEELTTLRKELEHLNHYLIIQQNRFADKLHWTVEAADELLDCELPKLLLQPLVENAIVHGIEPKLELGHIHIAISRCAAGNLVLQVSDDGMGMDTDEVARRIQAVEAHEPPRQRGFALRNMEERIQMRYGEPYGIALSSRAGEGTSVTITLPYTIRMEDSGK